MIDVDPCISLQQLDTQSDTSLPYCLQVTIIYCVSGGRGGGCIRRGIRPWHIRRGCSRDPGRPLPPLDKPRFYHAPSGAPRQQRRRPGKCPCQFGLEDPPRPAVPDTIRTCQAAGVKVIMHKGDHPHTAWAIAREIELIQSNSPAVITGECLRGMSTTPLQLALDAPEILFARIASDQKMEIINAPWGNIL